MTGADGARSLLRATRASYGSRWSWLPGPVIYLATGRCPGRCARRVAWVLGARHLIQAAISSLTALTDAVAETLLAAAGISAARVPG